jgi:CheY-like chemotaxis protein
MDRDRKRLLIVDDVELFIQLQISYLGRQRFEIHTARSGKEGLEKARSLKPDLILLDLHMPDIDGDEVCRTLKDDPETSSIPVVIVSSGSRDLSRASTISMGCDGLIFKPVRKDLLQSVVEELLGTEFRKKTRARVSIPATVVLEGKKFSSTIRSLSNSGAFLELDREVIRGDVIQLRFSLPDEGGDIEVRSAAVMWSGILSEEGPKGVGVKFLVIGPESNKRIRIFVNLLLENKDDLLLEKNDSPDHWRSA